MQSASFSDVSHVMDRLNQITECSICAETFSDPRVLPCIHTFCLKCIQATGERLNLLPKQTMPCPLCRDEFDIPGDGFRGLRKNFFMVNLIEMSLISNPLEMEKLCELCLENREDPGTPVPAAVMYCVECRQRLCEDCTKEHRRQRLSRSHQVLKLGTPLTDDLAKQFGPNYCEHHPAKTTDLFCASCRSVICMMCYAEAHNSHQCTDIIKKSEVFRTELGQDIGEVTGCLESLMDMRKMMKTERERFVTELEDCKTRVIKRNQELKETLERHTKSLLDELASLQTIGLEEYGKEMEEMERYLKTMETFKSYCEEMKSKGTPSDVCRSMQDLRKRTGELKELYAGRTKRPICTLSVSFRVTENEDYVNRHPNMVGEIKGTVTKIRNKVVATDNKAVNSRLTGRLDIADRHINGVAYLDHRIYVLLTNAIRIFEDTVPFTPITELTIPGMGSLVDIAACHNYACLYVTDRKKCCIWKLTCENKAAAMLEDISAPFTLSVSTYDNLVTVRWGQPSSVEIYGPDGILVDMVTLDPKIVLPYHAVQTSAGSIVLSHGGKGNRTHRILELSLEGRILRSFPEGDNPPRHLNCPLHLSLDEDDRVFVADYYNGVVLLLQQQLELHQVLALEEKDGVRRPSRLCYLADCKTLAVVNGNKFVDMYTMDQKDVEAIFLFQDITEVTKKPLGSEVVSPVDASPIQETLDLRSGRFF